MTRPSHAPETVDPDSTLADVRRPTGTTRTAVGRRVALSVLAVVVGAGALGLLGLRTASTSTSAGGYDLTLQYPQVARAGQDVRWQVRVTRAGGFEPGQDVVLAVSGDYFDVFETQGFVPEPGDDTRDADWRYLTFTPQDGSDVLLVDFDTYLQPSAQRGRTAVVRLLVDDEEIARLPYRTWVLP